MSGKSFYKVCIEKSGPLMWAVAAESDLKLGQMGSLSGWKANSVYNWRKEKVKSRESSNKGKEKRHLRGWSHRT